MSSPWMPLYVADYLADTRQLTTLEHGAYILLIMEYWRKGKLPKDDVTLARIVGLSIEDWQCVRIAMAMLFTEGWTHKRIEHELARAREKSDKARMSADNRWKNKRNTDNANALRLQSDGNAMAMLSQPQPYREERGYQKEEYRDVPTERANGIAHGSYSYDQDEEF